MIEALDHLVIGGSAAVYETLLGRRARDGPAAHRQCRARLRKRRSRAAVDGVRDTRPRQGGEAARAARRCDDAHGRWRSRSRVMAWRSGSPRKAATRPRRSRPTKPRASRRSTMSWCARPIPSAPSPSMPAGWDSTSGSTAAIEQWGARLLFFRCGDLVVEIAHDLKKGVSDAPDQLWGLSLARARRRQGPRAAQGRRPRRHRAARRPPAGQPGFQRKGQDRGRAHAGDRRSRPLVVMRRLALLLSSDGRCLRFPAAGAEAGEGPAAARPLPALVVEARGAAAHGERQDLDGAARGRRMGALRPAGHDLFRRCSRHAPNNSASRSATRRSASPTTGRAVDKPDRSGLDDVPWSAAFISWDIESAGVPRDLFCPDQRHTIYVERMVERARRAAARSSSRIRPNERAPQVGDLICASRDGSGTTLRQPQSRRRPLRHRGRGPAAAKSHAIGGNVGDSVTRSVFPLDESGFLSPISARPVFTVIENRLP